MKKVVIILLILLINSISVLSENHDIYDYKTLDMDLKIYSNISLEKTEASSKIESIEAELSLFPKTYFLQDILDLSIISDPKASIEEKDTVKYLWRSPASDSFDFSLNSKVRAKNAIVKLENKIKFPLQDRKYPEYTKETKFIDINKDIINTAALVAENEDDLYDVVFKLAEWTKNNIQYNLSTLAAESVYPSSWVLENKQGVCDEITNLFISFLRSLGIPARFVTGVVYSNLNNTWGGHGWAEVYFPDTGWVPFDVVFGQYGWLDSTHIKLKDSSDSGEPAIEYSWKSYGYKLNIGEIDLGVDLINKGEYLSSFLKLNVELLKNNVKAGSYVPIKVEIENPTNSYISTRVFITKAPKLLEDNTKQVLLKPMEKKSVYWILKLPENLEKDYTYRTVVEAKDFFGSVDSEELKYSLDEPYYSLNDAEEKISRLQEEQKKEFKGELSLICDSDKSFYYTYEKASIKCILRNTGNKNLNNLQICLSDNCETIDLQITRSYNINFNLSLEYYANKEIVISVKSPDIIKYKYLDIGIKDPPELIITNLNYIKEVSYGELNKISFDLELKTNALSLVGFSSNFENAQISNDLIGKKKIVIPFKAKFDSNEFVIKFKDKNNKEYLHREKINIKIINIPWYIKLLRNFGFSRY